MWIYPKLLLHTSTRISMIRIFLLHVFVCILISKAPLIHIVECKFNDSPLIYVPFVCTSFPERTTKNRFSCLVNTQHIECIEEAQNDPYINVNSMFMCLKMLKILYQPVCTQRCTMLEYRMNCTIATMLLFLCYNCLSKKKKKKILDEVVVAKFILTIQMDEKETLFFFLMKYSSG